jgi:hypothetical protein
MQDTGCKMQDTRCRIEMRVTALSHILYLAYPVCGFGSGLGARCPALGVDPVPGIGSQVPGTRDVAGQSGNKAVGQ